MRAQSNAKTSKRANMMNRQLREWWNKIRNSEARKVLLQNRNAIEKCPFCDHTVSDRSVSIYAELVETMYRVYCWCGKERKHEFKVKEIRQFFDQKNFASHRWSDLIDCSNGILYPILDQETKQRKKGVYGMNMARAREFFHGKRQVHMSITLNQITGEKMVIKDAYVHQIPALKAMLDSEGLYDHERIPEKVGNPQDQKPLW